MTFVVLFHLVSGSEEGLMTNEFEGVGPRANPNTREFRTIRTSEERKSTQSGTNGTKGPATGFTAKCSEKPVLQNACPRCNTSDLLPGKDQDGRFFFCINCNYRQEKIYYGNFVAAEQEVSYKRRRPPSHGKSMLG